MLTEIEDRAERVGARAVRLFVWPDNEHAIGLYERRGYARTGTSVDDDGRDQLLMARPLG